MDDARSKQGWSTPRRFELSARRTRGGISPGPYETSGAGPSCYPIGTGTS